MERRSPNAVFVFVGSILPAKSGIPKENAPVRRKTKTQTTISQPQLSLCHIRIILNIDMQKSVRVLRIKLAERTIAKETQTNLEQM